jgi:heme/copper-type cytochrome/quinol oxidase subunit 2
MRVVFWISAVAIVIAQAAILRTARSYIAAPSSPDRAPTPWLEGFWAFAPAVALAAILYVSWGKL